MDETNPIFSPPIIEISKIGSFYNYNSHIVICADDSVRIAVQGPAASIPERRYENQKEFAGMLLEYLVEKLHFFSLQNTYEAENDARDNSAPLRNTIHERAGAPNMLDAVYIIKLDIFGKKHEVAFSYSFCPDYLKSMRMTIDGIFRSAHRTEYLFLLLENLE